MPTISRPSASLAPIGCTDTQLNNASSGFVGSWAEVSPAAYLAALSTAPATVTKICPTGKVPGAASSSARI
ncbi:MAG: hypothetical protein QF879_04405 [Candidatus Latescibacteria bacterium]|nr:hypothetical protein [Candidatus Latescibacterota bacterium]MDP7235752.1 hypothetical protein [Candidatus Latescibacterota bacterium]